MTTTQIESGVDLRKFAGQFPTGVATSATADNQRKLHGITMSAVTSLALSPPLFLTPLTLGMILWIVPAARQKK